jgi:hypothetical protein
MTESQTETGGTSPSRLLKKFVLKRIFSIFAGATRGLIGRDRRCKGGMGYVFASL